MVIYYDLVLLLNFIINFSCLLLIETIFKDQVNYLKITLASSIGAVIIFSALLDYIYINLFKISGGIIISLVAFDKGINHKRVIKIALFYIINFTLVGILSAFKIKEVWLLGLSFLGLVILVGLETNKRYYIFLRHYQYNISVTLESYTFTIKGYLDTGNFAKSNNDLPVIFIDTKYFNNSFKQYSNIDIETINGDTSIKTYLPSYFEIKYKNKRIKKEVEIAFMEIREDFDCLLNVWLFI